MAYTHTHTHMHTHAHAHTHTNLVTKQPINIKITIKLD